MASKTVQWAAIAKLLRKLSVGLARTVTRVIALSSSSAVNGCSFDGLTARACFEVGRVIVASCCNCSSEVFSGFKVSCLDKPARNFVSHQRVGHHLWRSLSKDVDTPSEPSVVRLVEVDRLVDECGPFSVEPDPKSAMLLTLFRALLLG